MNVLLLNYTHPEGYPPTFNAISELSRHCNEITVLSKATIPTVWKYNDNVSLILQEELKDRFSVMQKSKLEKFQSYLEYFLTLRKLITKKKPELIILHDPLPFLFFILVKYTILGSIKSKIWYHNHDIHPRSKYKKLSINWVASLITEKKFGVLDYFSLPSQERKKYFPLQKFNGKYFFIPNFPSKQFHGKIKLIKRQINKQINITYPGNISNKHGFEELIPVLNEKIDNKEIHLYLVGDINVNYKEKLIHLANQNNVTDHLHFLSRISYFEIPNLLNNYHIGWAVNKPIDITYSTGGTAANKIYEYIALSLPIILFENTHYEKYFGEKKWAKFTDLTRNSILRCLKEIVTNYAEISESSYNDFQQSYYFEKAFVSALSTIKEDL